MEPGNLADQFSDALERVNSPHIPDGMKLRGTSTLYDPQTGEPKLQWVKAATQQETVLAWMAEALEALGEKIAGAADPIDRPTDSLSDLLTVYPIGDPHIGMYAWGEETGDDFDLDVACRDLATGIEAAAAMAPASETAIVLPLGDIIHADFLSNTTTRGTVLDVDTRWPKVMQAGVQAIRHAVDVALGRHDRIIVRVVVGNHDRHSAHMLGMALAMLYEREPRVTVDTSPSPFWFYRFGSTLLGATHGDDLKPQKLPGVMACDAAEEWGQTQHRYWLIGHVHHQSRHELQGCTVESFRTLAARDAWHTGQGYRSGRDLHAITYHCEHGEVARARVDISMVRALQEPRP